MKKISCNNHKEIVKEVKSQTVRIKELLKCVTNITDLIKTHPPVSAALYKNDSTQISEKLFKKLESDFSAASLEICGYFPEHKTYIVYGVLQIKVKKSKSADDYIHIPIFWQNGRFTGTHVDVHGWVEYQ